MSTTTPTIAQCPAPRARPGAECAQGPIHAPRPPVTLQQAVTELNEVVLRGRAEIAGIEKLHEFLRVQLRGPIPCDPSKDCAAPHLPLGEIPTCLAEQTVLRGKLLDDIAQMLGMG
jgi:hypothetical protein